MKKVYHPISPQLVASGLFVLVALIATIYVPLKGLLPGSAQSYLFFFIVCALFLVLVGSAVVHYGQAKIVIDGENIIWTKAKFVLTRTIVLNWGDRLRHAFFAYAAKDLTETNVTEEFCMRDVTACGFLRDFTSEEFKLEERFPKGRLPDKIIVFKLKDDQSFYISVQYYPASQIRYLLTKVEELSGTAPRDVCKRRMGL